MANEVKNLLISELLAMAKSDQAMRSTYQATNEWDTTVDIVNTARLKEIIDQYGWPTITQVGKKAASAAWLLAQHADKDKEFQKRCLKLMKELPKDEVLLSDLALLEDRVRTGEGQPQLYGTQFSMAKGTFGPLPIADEEQLEKRRSKMGLGSFSEYTTRMREMYDEYQASITKKTTS